MEPTTTEYEIELLKIIKEKLGEEKLKNIFLIQGRPDLVNQKQHDMVIARNYQGLSDFRTERITLGNEFVLAEQEAHKLLTGRYNQMQFD